MVRMEEQGNMAGRQVSVGTCGLWGSLGRGVEGGERMHLCIQIFVFRFRELEIGVRGVANLVGGCLRGVDA